MTDFYRMRAEAVDEEGVREALMPELELIKDQDLREKVVKAWALACRMGGYERLEDIPTERFEWLPDFPNIQHQKDTARIASAITRALRELGVELNEDHVVTGAICHDLGKPFEWRNNQSGVFSTRTGAGVFYGENPNMPTLEGDVSYQVARHPMWSLYIAMAVGMPEHIVHIVASHSREGELLLRSPEAWVVRHADEIWWRQVARKAMGGYPGPTPQWREGPPSHWRRFDART